MSNDSMNHDNVPAALVEKKTGIALVWIIPIIAACLGGWLVYKSIVESDIAIKIHFNSGEGLSAGKTEIRYKGIVIGKVESIELDGDLSGVVAMTKVNRKAKKVLNTGTQFWLIKPEISFAGVRGLDTLLSGNYIAISPGEGKEKLAFTALDEAPVSDDEFSGLSISLEANTLGSIHIGSPIHYREITVGEIVSYALDEKQNKVFIKAHINKNYAHLVRKNTRFWNSSGLSISGSFPHINISTGSLASLISGGVSFNHPENESADLPAEKDQTFTLYKNYDVARSGIRITIEMPDAEDINVNGTQIKYKGITVATIRSILPNKDFSGVIAEAIVDPKAKFALNTSTRFWMVKPNISLSEISGLSTIVKGSHIEVDFKEGEFATHFKLLEKKPNLTDKTSGLHITLTTESLGGLSVGSKVYYHQIPIGSVQKYELDDSKQKINVSLYIEQEYQALITKKSRFYNTSGIKVSGGLNGVSIEAESLASLLTGGIGIVSPDLNTKHAVLAKNGHRYNLYSDKSSADNLESKLSIRIADGSGIKTGTPLKHQGRVVGEVIAIELSDSDQQVVASVQLLESTKIFARAGSEFWVSRAALGLSKVTNLDAIITGPYLSVNPGAGATQLEFTSLPHEPLTRQLDTGLNLILEASRLGSIKPGVPIYYRDIPVGKVIHYELGATAQHVDITINIEERFKNLVNANTRFWNTSGIGVDFSLFNGAKIRTDTLESIISGGIAFATPDAGSDIKNNQRYTLLDEPKDEWTKWSPAIKLESK